ncbi:hypothetical protein [Flammeovirga agarivorans]|uniref:Uncharacterized protein n=1 Tax=Flammeovirga agarivorans TaxID=2726742 RepID=A0A7X8SRG8_9BACT|nr:hypothetical protein [Flammeovirga agarivorans]NLR95069.1 hypothetical protein [Flammeovirga agarivorans]
MILFFQLLLLLSCKQEKIKANVFFFENFTSNYFEKMHHEELITYSLSFTPLKDTLYVTFENSTSTKKITEIYEKVLNIKSNNDIFYESINDDLDNNNILNLKGDKEINFIYYKSFRLLCLYKEIGEDTIIRQKEIIDQLQTINKHK